MMQSTSEVNLDEIEERLTAHENRELAAARAELAHLREQIGIATRDRLDAQNALGMFKANAEALIASLGIGPPVASPTGGPIRVLGDHIRHLERQLADERAKRVEAETRAARRAEDSKTF